MNWILWGVLSAAAILGLTVWVIRRRYRDIEEVIRQGRPVLLRCAKLRVEGKASVCSQNDPTIGC